tara:strand:+ start:621 stop:863 length:243 start_codon:yes stop_codon:yes gene_type:complete
MEMIIYKAQINIITEVIAGYLTLHLEAYTKARNTKDAKNYVQNYFDTQYKNSKTTIKVQVNKLSKDALALLNQVNNLEKI